MKKTSIKTGIIKKLSLLLLLSITIIPSPLEGEGPRVRGLTQSVQTTHAQSTISLSPGGRVTEGEGADAVSLNFNFQINPPQNPGETKKKLTLKAEPGKNYQDKITLENHDPNKSIIIKLYPSDSVPTSNGSIGFKLQSDEQFHIGRWMDFQKSIIKLKPLQKIDATYEIIIPKNTPPGTYIGAINAEIIEPLPSPLKEEGGRRPGEEPPSEKETESERSAIKIVSRRAEPFLLEIPGDKIYDFNITDFSISKNLTENYDFNIAIQNKGNVYLQSDASINIIGWPQNPPTQTLNGLTVLPNSNAEKKIPWQNPPFIGTYDIILKLNISEFDLTTQKHVHLQTLEKTIKFQIFPIKEAIFMLIFLTILLAIIVLRRHQHKVFLKNCRDYQTKNGDTITKIAQQFHINWKKLAKINNIKSPYTIRPNQTIKVPSLPKKTKKDKNQ